MKIKSIAVLGHDIGCSPGDYRYIISYLCQEWHKRGIEIKIIRGVNNQIKADVVINHVDLTITPDNYMKYMDKYEYKINFNVRDISKKLYSNNILDKNDDYAGKVFVKTDANCGGKIDYYFERIENQDRSLFEQNRDEWNSKQYMDSFNYRLFNNINEIPSSVWANENLIVEKFVPEIIDQDLFQVRYWLFMGNNEINVAVQSHKPVVKGKNIINRYKLDNAPDELRDYRLKYNFDYGRFDYSIVDGKLNLFDMNRTPTIGKNMKELLEDKFPSYLADGLADIVGR